MLIGFYGSCPYIVGDTIHSINSTFDPNKVYLGTSWSRIKGRVITGVDETQQEFNTVGKTGGSKSFSNAHSHSTGSLALARSHLPTGITGDITMHNKENCTNVYSASGVFEATYAVPKYGSTGTGTAGAWSIGQFRFDLGGGGESHNHGNTGVAGSSLQSTLPPYITRYIWERIS